MRAALFATVKVLFSLYATLFLAVATPFLPHNCVFVYLVGGYISLLFLCRMFLSWYSLFRLNGALVSINSGRVSLSLRGNEFFSEGENLALRLLFTDFLLLCTADGWKIIPLSVIKGAARKELTAHFIFSPSFRNKITDHVDFIFEIAVIALLIAVHIIYYIAGNFYVPTGSMKDTLVEGDWIIAEKVSYGIRIPKMAGMRKELRPACVRFSSPKRGDVIVFRFTSLGEEREYVKRCVAVAGDDLRVQDGGIYINGKLVDEEYTRGLTSYRFFEAGKIDGIVPPGHIVVLGDNREDSRDSREFGYIPVDSVVGRVVLLYSNLNSIKNFDFFRFGFVR